VQFEEYVAARGQALLRFAYVLTADHHRAQDVVQSALVDAYRHWRKVSRAGDPDAYVRRIVVNAHLSWHRRRSSTESPSPTGIDHVGTVPDHADGVVERDETRRVLNGLAPRARSILVLRYYLDLDDAAIAELLNVSPSNVRATASRALSLLRQQNNPGPLSPTAAGEPR
jgi:RNA polymerase sigma-70 factor (sigma-E family)